MDLAEINSCGATNRSKTIANQPLELQARVTNHSKSEAKYLYMEFKVTDRARAVSVTRRADTSEVSAGRSDQALPSVALSLDPGQSTSGITTDPLKWFPGELDVECVLKADVLYLTFNPFPGIIDAVQGLPVVPDDPTLDTIGTKVQIYESTVGDPVFAFGDCNARRDPVLVGEKDAILVKAIRESRRQFDKFNYAAEYMVNQNGLEGYATADQGATVWTSGGADESLRTITTQRTFLRPGRYTMDCLLWKGTFRQDNSLVVVYGEAVEALVRIGTFLLQLKSGNWVALVSDLTDGDPLTVETIQDWERRWFPNSLQAVKTSEFSVAAARWGATEPGVETEKLSDGRQGVTVRVYREESTSDQVNVPKPQATVNSVKGPPLGRPNDAPMEAVKCPEEFQPEVPGSFASYCWEASFVLPVNDTVNDREYNVEVGSPGIADVRTVSVTVEPGPDVTALESLYRSAGGLDWQDRFTNGWLSDAPVGDWYGVVTDGNGRVTGLNLRAYGLRGAIPLGLELPNLRDWNLDDNAGLNEGCIPESLRDVDGSNSESLGLPYCGDTCAYGGALPAPTNGMLVDDCEALLKARNALLRGEDDPEKLNWSTREPIQNWRGITVGGNPQRVTKLEIVDRPNGRELSGLISRELARLSALQVLNLDGQGLDGEIPTQLGDLANLQTLSLQSNLLDGRIPSGLSNLKRLNVLNLSENYLSGRIPGKLQNLVDNLKTLKLAYNPELNDCIPERLMSVPDNDLAELELEVCGTVATWVSDDPSFDPASLEAGGGAVTVEIRTQELKGTPTPVTAPSMSVSGPGLDLTNTASPCAEAQREIGSYIERCWTVTFEAPPNESTTSANSYEVTVRSDLVQGNPVGEITVAAAPAILEKPGETNNLEKPDETTTEPEPTPVEVVPGTTPSLPVITLPLTIGVVLPEIELDYDDDDDGDDDGAPTQTDTQSQATGRVKASFQKFYVIDVDLDEYGDHDRECKLQLGGEYRLADWNDLTEYYAAGGSIPELISGLNWKDEKTTDVGVRGPKVSKDGNERWGGGRRHYFVARHDHVPPGNFLVHNHIDNYHLSLGSWYGEGGEALCFRLGAAAVNTVVSGPAFARNPTQDFETLTAAGNNHPEGIWSDGTTMWVGDTADDKIYAYNLATKARDAGKDFNTLADAGNNHPEGIWSDRTTMWVVDEVDDKIYAYDMATKARDTGKDFSTLPDADGFSDHIWSDRTTMWLTDALGQQPKIYAYNLGTKARDAGKDFNTLADAGNSRPEGIWSDGTTMWVADISGDKIYAYNLGTKARDAGKDFNTLFDAGNNVPSGLWSDEATIWVGDYEDGKIYAYNMPP